jgi:hypothetical protein
VKQLCKELDIHIIRGRAYHPQTQGTVERANRTFKKRLGALQAQKKRSDWVLLLPELALVLNTTTTRVLPQKKTPFEVWFGRKPHWITAKPVEVDKNGNAQSDDECSSDTDYNSELENDILNEIETRVAAHNNKLNAQMIKANSGRAATFVDGTVATLQIPVKLRLATEPSRIPVRVLELTNSQYKLQCQWGRLMGRYQGGELNHVEAGVGNTLGATILTNPKQLNGKELTISLPKAVAQMNNRSSIAAAQKAGRKPKLSSKPALKAGMKRKRTEIEAIAEEPSLHRLRGRNY